MCVRPLLGGLRLSATLSDSSKKKLDALKSFQHLGSMMAVSVDPLLFGPDGNISDFNDADADFNCFGDYLTF